MAELLYQSAGTRRSLLKMFNVGDFMLFPNARSSDNFIKRLRALAKEEGMAFSFRQKCDGVRIIRIE